MQIFFFVIVKLSLKQIIEVSKHYIFKIILKFIDSDTAVLGKAFTNT